LDLVLSYVIRFYRAYNIVTQSKRELERIKKELESNPAETACLNEKIATITAHIEKVKKAEEINLRKKKSRKPKDATQNHDIPHHGSVTL
jgi:hypothetical protein